MARSRTPVDELLGAAPAPPDDDRPVAIAFSGGLDSTVLLHGAVRLLGPGRVLALHVHHGLQPAADDFAAHSLARSAALGVACSVLRARGAPARGESVEHWARRERYRLLCAAAREADARALATAHHADDQLETLLLAMARGCGLDGLTGIAAHGLRDGVALLRPLLALDRAALQADARARGLDWIDDPSNGDDAFPRNAVRARVAPVLREVLPTLAAQLPATLALLAGARRTLDALAAQDLLAVAQREGGASAATAAAASAGSPAAAPKVGPTVAPEAARGVPVPVLDRTRLAALPSERADAVLRAWVVATGAAPPPLRVLAELRVQLVDGRGARGEVAYAGWRWTRHRDRIEAWPRAAIPPRVEPAELCWRGEPALALPGGGRLRVAPDEAGVSADWLAGRTLSLAAPASSQRLRPVAGGPSRTLKNLWQEAGVPVALRGALPAVAVDGRLLWAAPFGMDRDPRWPRSGARVALAWDCDDPGDPRARWTARPPATGAPPSL
jgi:tRNA(Ile)-lysidine synthase